MLSKRLEFIRNLSGGEHYPSSVMKWNFFGGVGGGGGDRLSALILVEKKEHYVRKPTKM